MLVSFSDSILLSPVKAVSRQHFPGKSCQECFFLYFISENMFEHYYDIFAREKAFRNIVVWKP